MLIQLSDRAQADIIAGSRDLAKAIYAARNGAQPFPVERFRWSRADNSGTWASAGKGREEPLVEMRQAKVEFASTLVVRRDPCPKCGVRSDIGCKHTARAA
jgi:hypothetical protein